MPDKFEKSKLFDFSSWKFLCFLEISWEESQNFTFSDINLLLWFVVPTWAFSFTLVAWMQTNNNSDVIIFDGKPFMVFHIKDDNDINQQFRATQVAKSSRKVRLWEYFCWNKMSCLSYSLITERGRIPGDEVTLWWFRLIFPPLRESILNLAVFQYLLRQEASVWKRRGRKISFWRFLGF